MDKVNFFERIYQSIRKLVNRIKYSQILYEQYVWELRFSKQHQDRLKYTTEKKLFTLSIKGIDDIYKYCLLIMMFIMLFVMIFMSRSVGVSTREMEQNHYTELVYNHFHHIGDNPDAYKDHQFASTQAQYVDLIAFSIGKTLHVKDVFLIKHILSAVFGWLLIFYLSILVLKAFNWRAAFFTAFFLLISPRFFGYSLSNLVDVTFAFGFVFTITQMYYFSRELPVIRVYRLVKIVLGTLLAVSTYNAGFVLMHFFFIFVVLNYILYNPLKKLLTLEYWKSLGILCLMVLATTVTVSLIHGACTFFLNKSLVLPRNAFALLTMNFPVAQNQLFGGHVIGPDNFPHSYLAKYLFITIPTVVLIGALMFFVFFRTAIKSLKLYSIFIILYPFFYCIDKVKSCYLNIDTMWAIYYYIYPLFMLIAASGIECTLQCINDKYTNFVVIGLIALLSFMPIRHIAYNRNMATIYFNELAGGINDAYAKYALDGNEDINKSACLWLKDYLQKNEIGKYHVQKPFVVATNGNEACKLFLQDADNIDIVIKPYTQSDSTWDYFISFCIDVPSTQLRNRTWPPDSAFYLMNIETMPIVAFYKNEARLRQRSVLDSMILAEQARLDSLAEELRAGRTN